MASMDIMDVVKAQEAIEPERSEDYAQLIARVIGLGYKRCEDARALVEKGAPRFVLEEACNRWWSSVKCLDLMLVVIKVPRGELSFASIALGNEMSKMATYIKEHLGFDPFLDLDADGQAQNEKVPPGWYVPRLIHAR